MFHSIDHVLFHSVAILRYLARTFPVSDHWYPKDNSKLQAKIDAYMAYQHLATRSFGSMYFVTGYVIPKSTKQPVNEQKLAKYKKGLNTVLDEISNIWLKDGRFIGGKDLTIADLLAVTELEQPSKKLYPALNGIFVIYFFVRSYLFTGLAGYDVRTYNKKILDYMTAVRETLQPHYDQVHSACYELQKKALKKN